MTGFKLWHHLSRHGKVSSFLPPTGSNLPLVNRLTINKVIDILTF